METFPMRRCLAILTALGLVASVVGNPKPGSGQGDEPQPKEVGGIAAGDRTALLFDAQNRPITAGGFVDDAPVIFLDVTEGSGLDAFRNRAGGPEKSCIVETKGAAVAVLDYDRDGWLDVYLLSAGPFEALRGEAAFDTSRLYRNRGNGRFEDVTAAAGVENRAWAMGVVAGDFDGDGWVDLYVSNLGPNRLYRNLGDGRFEDVAGQAGVQLPEYGTTGATFGDFDRDGDLDLFVCGYLNFDARRPPRPGVDIAVNFCRYRGVEVMCGPRGLSGTRDFLFRNNGDGTFTETAEAAGVADHAGHYGFSSAFVDVNNDGWLDLVVVNDSTPNYLYLNRGDGTFEDVSYLSGFALNLDGRSQAGMGLAVGDYNLDGWVDFFLAHFSDDYNTLYRNQGGDFFLDVSYEAGIADGSLPFVGWGSGFLDFDNDGLLDIFVANGHVYPVVDRFRWGTSWKQRPLLFRNLDGERFAQVPARPDSGLGIVVTGRGAAFGDFDGDGRVDVVINCLDSAPKLLKNVAGGENGRLVVELVGGDGIPTDGVGSVVYVTAGGRRMRRDAFTGGSFASCSDPRMYFGLDKAEQVDELEVRWPDGRVDCRRDLPANHRVRIRPGGSTESFRLRE